jgi:hypothetical protein
MWAMLRDERTYQEQRHCPLCLNLRLNREARRGSAAVQPNSDV